MTDLPPLSELRKQVFAAGYRVTQNPDAADPEWQAALDELGELLALAEQIDPLFPLDREAEAAKHAQEPRECRTCGEPADIDGRIEHRPGTPCTTDYRAI